MANKAQGNEDRLLNFIEQKSFIIEEYKTLREEIKATKYRLFLITSIGIAAIPALLAWVTTSKSLTKYLMLFEAAIPFLVVSAMLIFLSENRNLMRCGRYIRKCIEPSLKDDRYPLHMGWEKWLESDNDENKEEFNNIANEPCSLASINKLHDKIPGKKFLVSRKNFDNRAVDRLIVASFLIIFTTYYILSSMIVVVSLWGFLFYMPSLLVFCFYSYIGLLLGAYSIIHYHDLVSTAHQDKHKLD
ncbi:hypothetical protein VU05_02015 [Desulfobulbus sp. F1]|nr:hypothetical protein [Desulfobulbus sp. F1]